MFLSKFSFFAHGAYPLLFNVWVHTNKSSWWHYLQLLDFIATDSFPAWPFDVSNLISHLISCI